MEKKRIPYGWGVPLGCAIAMLAGRMGPGTELLVAWLGCNLLTLFAPDTLRRASSRAMNDDMLAGMQYSAMVTMLPALALVIWLTQYWSIIGAGLLLVWMNVNQSMMEARRDTLSLFLLDVLAAAAIVVALVAFPDWTGQSCLIASAGLALLAVAFGYLPMRGRWSLSTDYFREIPLSFLRNLIWPTVGIGIYWMEIEFRWNLDILMLTGGFALGCVVMEVCRPMFRFSPMEGSRMRRIIPIAAMIVCLACLGLTSICPHITDILAMLLPAMGCALCVFGPAQVRTFVAGILLILPGTRFLWAEYMETGSLLVPTETIYHQMHFNLVSWNFSYTCIILILIAILTTIPDWMMAIRLRKAKRMRRAGIR